MGFLSPAGHWVDELIPYHRELIDGSLDPSTSKG